MSDTIFFKGKLKRGRDPLEVFEKLKKGIKKKGPTKNWICKIDENRKDFFIDFQDEGSETFSLQFNEKGEFNDFCKVAFPLEGDLFEAGKSEFKALLDILYIAKSMFNSIEITDDYGLAASYWDSKRFKSDFRNLTAEEEARVRRLFAEGFTTHEQLLMAVMAEDMEMSVEELRGYENKKFPDDFEYSIYHTLETYLYETAEFQKEGRVCELPDWHWDPSSFLFSFFAFFNGISWVFFDGTGPYKEIYLGKKRITNPKDKQVELLFTEKFAPLFMKEEDPLEKCILAYRYFVSVYDYLGFRYVGRVKINTAKEPL